MQDDVVSVERLIAAPPERIFELVADAAKHPLIDGSGTVREVQEGAPQRLSRGSEFGMSMRAGLPYAMVSKVIEYDDNRRIAWQSRPKGPIGMLVGGRIWRYELEPADGGTRVRESWDITRDRQRHADRPQLFERICLVHGRTVPSRTCRMTWCRWNG